jgi:hypothetical protein
MHSTDNLEDNYFGSGRILWYSIKKYGREHHTKTILEFLSSRTDLVLREKELITSELILEPNCMNLAIGGNAHATEEQRLKWKLTPRKKIVRTEEQIAAMKLERSLRKHTPETKLKISIANKKPKTAEHIKNSVNAKKALLTEEKRFNLGNGNRNRILSEEHKQKISAGGKAVWSEEKRLAQSAKQKAAWAKRKSLIEVL